MTAAESHLLEGTGDSVSGLGFGGVYALCYTGNMRRHGELMNELGRVGLPAEVVWDFPTPYKQFVLSSIPHQPFFDSLPGTWGATISQYRAIKTAYERGQDRVLIVEDDCRFLQDVGAVSRSLAASPADWDILMLDSIYTRGTPVNGWARVALARSTACYALRRKAMERLINMYESPVSGKYPHPMMRVCDQWLDCKYLGNDVKIYISVPNLAVQQDCGDRSNWGDIVARSYRENGIDRSKYAPFTAADVSEGDEYARI